MGEKKKVTRRDWRRDESAKVYILYGYPNPEVAPILCTADSLDEARRDTLYTLLRLLERGDRLSQNGTSWMGSAFSTASHDDRNARIRALRRHLIERDLYEQMYGPLPIRVDEEGGIWPTLSVRGEDSNG